MIMIASSMYLFPKQPNDLMRSAPESRMIRFVLASCSCFIFVSSSYQ